MQTMHWHNPTIQEEEKVPAPMFEAQAMEMLSGHPDSNRFVEEYRRMRGMHPDVVKALALTGETFYREHRMGQPPG